MVEVRPIREDDIAGFNAAVDRVAREKRFLARTEGATLEQSAAFVRGNLAAGNPQFVAVDDGAIIGWCDIVRNERSPIYRHRGTLGMGLVDGYRGRGLGGSLIEPTIAAALGAGMTRIELTVRADNDAAVRLYRRMGFAMEGSHRRTDLIDGVYYDTHSMALIA